MPSATDPYVQLKQHRAFRRLLAVGRSDNPLIALGVTKREVSWTRFQAWLLDPLRHSRRLGRCFVETLVETALSGIEEALERTQDDVGRGHLDALRALAPFRGARLHSARAEVTEGTKGRSDLVVECTVKQTHATILVENKIEATEHKDQLRGYVEQHLREAPPGSLVLPILMELGDDAVGASSCPWAVCWQRPNVEAWLVAAGERCARAGIQVPALVGQYLQLFESWDLAATLRHEARPLIERIERSKHQPAGWVLVGDWLTVGDRPFFKEVLQNRGVQAALRAHGLELTRTEGVILGRNEVLKITKANWTLPQRGPGGEGVNVHFESRHRGSLRLDIEITPYESGIAQRPDRMAALRELLELRANMHRAIRSAVPSGGGPEGGLTISIKGLRRPEAPSTCTAVKFDMGLSPECTTDEHAKLVVAAVRAATPVVDRVVARFGDA